MDVTTKVENKTEFIICEQQDLKIQVLNDDYVDQKGDFLIQALFYDKVAKEVSEVYFKVVDADKNKDYPKWSFKLFFDAIKFYSRERYANKKLEGFDFITNESWFPEERGITIEQPVYKILTLADAGEIS